MSTDPEATQDVVIADLLARVTVLEQRLAARPTPEAAPLPEVLDDEALWALRGLQERLPPGAGGVLLTGAVPLPAGRSALWQQAHLSDDLLQADPQLLAARLGALGSPVRLRLLREVLAGRTSSGELAADAQFGTSGQVQHHLRQLVAAGWLRATSRGHYDVPVDRVVPLLVAWASAHG